MVIPIQTQNPDGTWIRFDFTQVCAVEENKQGGNDGAPVVGLVLFLLGSTLFLEGKNVEWWLELEQEIMKRMNTRLITPGGGVHGLPEGLEK